MILWNYSIIQHGFWSLFADPVSFHLIWWLGWNTYLSPNSKHSSSFSIQNVASIPMHKNTYLWLCIIRRHLIMRWNCIEFPYGWGFGYGNFFLGQPSFITFCKKVCLTFSSQFPIASVTERCSHYLWGPSVLVFYTWFQIAGQPWQFLGCW